MLKKYNRTTIALGVGFLFMFLLKFFRVTEQFDIEMGLELLIKDKWLFDFTCIYTMLCNPPVAVAIVAVIAILFFAFKKWSQGVLISVSTGLGAALNHFIKEIFEFERPSFRLIEESGFTFPSGHSNAAAAICVSLFIIVQNSNLTERQKRVSTFFLSLIALSIAFSRVMLGVHFLTDIAAGLMLGSFVSMIVYNLMRVNNLYKM